MSFESVPLRQDWEQDLPRYWFDNSPFKTHLMNAFSSQFPEGEKFFVDSVMNFKSEIQDETLLQDMKIFSHQEHWHSFAHKQYNIWLDKIGVPVKQVEQHTYDTYRLIKEKDSQRACLGTTMCLEHLTTIVSEFLLSHPEVQRQMHPHFLKLWKWHSIEELEHKSIAIDVYRRVGGNEPKRKMLMLITLGYFLKNLIQNTILYLKVDGQLWRWRTLVDGVSFLFNFRNGLVPCLIIPFFKFFKDNYHPLNISHQQLISNHAKI